LGVTTLYVTHDQAEAMTLGQRIAVMREGKLQQLAAPLDIYNSPANRFVAEFVGSPGMNFLDGRIDPAKATFEADGISLPMPRGQIEKLSRFQHSSRVTLGIRPEHVEVSHSWTAGSFAASVYVNELMGSETLVFLSVAGQQLVARAREDFRAEVESSVWMKLDGSKCHFFDLESGNVIAR